MKKLILIMLMGLVLISCVNGAESVLGTYKTGECVDLIQLCSTCTYNNLTSVVIKADDGNNTRIEIWTEMEQRGVEYNYTWCDTEQSGIYNINGHGDLQGTDTVWAYKIRITPSGEEPDGAKATMYVSLFFGLLVFFAIALIGLFKIEDYKGRFALYWVTHLLFIAVTFVGWTMSSEFLTNVSFLAGMFRIIFWVAIGSVIPMFFLSLAWIFYIHTMSDEIRNMMEKGMTPEEAFKKSGQRRYF